MKEIISKTTQIIENKEVSYACEICDFTNKSSREVKSHEAKHFVKGQKYIGGLTFYRFDTEANMKAWAERMVPECDYVDCCKFQGEGWYGAEQTSKPAPYSNVDYGIALFHSSKIIAEWHETLGVIQNDINNLEELVGQ